MLRTPSLDIELINAIGRGTIALIAKKYADFMLRGEEG
jgi:hypothetical protein